MSNTKKAYGWFGHILVPVRDGYGVADMDPANVVSIGSRAFDAIVDDYEALRLPDGVDARRLGYLNSDFMFLASGVSFSEGYTFYGGQFAAANLLLEGSMESILALRAEGERYINAMRERYCVKLPSCRMMIGCSTEH